MLFQAVFWLYRLKYQPQQEGRIRCKERATIISTTATVAEGGRKTQHTCSCCGMQLSPCSLLLPALTCTQVEGAADAEGRAASIWDDFSSVPGKVAGNDTGSIAADHYHLFQQDVQLMGALGIQHYR